MSVRRWLLAAIAIPLSSPTGWQDLRFKKIPPNANVFSPAGLEIKVDRSSSPLIFPLKDAIQVISFRARLQIEGQMNKKSGFPEDAYLRLGLVAPGARRLNGFERMMAADWLKKLFSLAPKDGGVDKVYFFNLADHANGENREFPGSKGLMVEKIVSAREMSSPEPFAFEFKMEKPIPTVALWLSVDGDDSQSSYTLRLKSLELEAKQPDPEKSE